MRTHYSFTRPFILLIFISMAFVRPQVRAQIAPSDFVMTLNSQQFESGGTNFIYIPVYGGYDLYVESIPAGFSASAPGSAHGLAFQVPTAGKYRAALRPRFVGLNPPLSYIYFFSSGYNESLLSIEQWGTAQWSTMYRSFRNCSNLSAISAADAPDLSIATDIREAFQDCSSLTSAPNINNWNVGNVTNMFAMFFGASAFNLALNNWNVSNVTNFGGMFYNATAFNQPLSSWDVSSAIDMNSMFANATSFNQPLNSWDVGNATFLNYMFYGATAFDQPLNTWDVSSATRLEYMFYGATAFNQPLNSWNVSSVINLSNMFNGATGFDQLLDDWTLNANADLSLMLNASGMDCSNYSKTLIGWATNPAIPSGRSLGAAGKTYGPDASTARNLLVTTKGWTITGDAFDAGCVVLPVTLVSFEAAKQEYSSLLTWSTSEETNSDRFEIQRSREGKNWFQIGVLASSGESTGLKTYRFRDDLPLEGSSYYRLKMVDRDESFTYSRIRKVDFGTSSRVSVYPNPASDLLLLNDYSSVKGVTLYNTVGSILLEVTKITAQGIDIRGFTPGLHTVKMTLTDGSTKMSKVMITK